MKRKLVLLSIFLSVNAFSQTGINTKNPDASAQLDIVSNNKGLLIPRMTTAQRTDISQPAHALLVYDTEKRGIMQNIGTPAAPSWVLLGVRDNAKSFFYMPSVSIDASAVVTNQNLDLYNEYKKQFTGADPSTFAKSAGAPNEIPYFNNATDLYYYIGYFDSTVIKVNTINANGVLNYDILKEAPFDSFMNVIFVVKP